MADGVIELDVHGDSSGPPPAVKARLEKHAAEVEKAKKEWPEEKRARYEEHLEKHALNREKFLQERVAKARATVQHAKDVHKSHQERMAESVHEMKSVLAEKHAWADHLRKDFLNEKSDKGHQELVKVLMATEEKKLQDGFSALKLAQALEDSQKLAEKNRKALEQYKRVSAEAEVEHAMEVHDALKEKDEAARHMMEVSLEQHQDAAEELRHALLLYRTAKAHEEVEKAKEVAAAHLSEEQKKLEALKTELAKKEKEAQERHEARLREISGEEAQQEPIPFSSAALTVTIEQLSRRLESLVRSLSQQQELFDELFKTE
mmetsp:Transcript_19334/g.26655  ORF Transcript_19334/g.26655 Transcript_19334/m.26655 type:complete len:319 (-) Transcript_19334:29-985(-)|eukprot:CAMPEP_0201490494 /NCGR_PEP_ID=MMETSP0151_2-20130828/26585_1 /ASSEMBLY_ACC=CAM_ASM_000257 /TAXON_ID=200890 /ORGANISM="Paramoeba atlantica, Strain 621/1 / CCAP 1560/9" /LENGTH=318 /DNA_ID=CAMNT_0047876473 /DNA_START=118 /DNA_END=1074 /DNA_ORIENTATION=+